MTAIIRNESRRLVRGSLVLGGAYAVLMLFILSVFPSMADEAELIEEAFPDAMHGLFGFEEMHTLEGFIGSYVFSLMWVVFIGLYVAYVAGGMIAGDIRERRMDLILANPVSRESVVLQKFGSLWVPITVLIVVQVVMLYGGSVVLDETLDPVVLILLHVLSVPYLLVCAAIGMILSVVLSRVETAQAGALAIVFLLWLLEGLSEFDPDYEWIGEIAPSRHFDPAAILIHEEYAWIDAGVLLIAAIVLIGIAILLFVRRDI